LFWADITTKARLITDLAASLACANRASFCSSVKGSWNQTKNFNPSVMKQLGESTSYLALQIFKKISSQREEGFHNFLQMNQVLQNIKHESWPYLAGDFRPLLITVCKMPTSGRVIPRQQRAIKMPLTTRPTAGRVIPRHKERLKCLRSRGRLPAA